MNIFKHKSRYGHHTNWVVATEDGYVWGMYRTLKTAKNHVEWLKPGVKASRRIDMDFKTKLVWHNEKIVA
jgi:hypothetical protein